MSIFVVNSASRTVCPSDQEIRLHFDVETDAPQSDLAQLLEMTERYCVIFQTIQNSLNTKTRMSVVRN